MTDIIGDSRGSWLNPSMGPIRRIWASALSDPDPRWWIFGTELSRSPRDTFWSLADFSAAGASIDRVEALTRALGETLERHASLNSLDEDDAVDMGRDEPDISARFALCDSSENCPPMFKGENWTSTVGHVRMSVLSTGATAWVPMPYVHLGYPTHDWETLSTFPISTGTAFSPKRETAVWRGFCEVVERDAVMLAWLTRRGFTQILIQEPVESRSLNERLLRLRIAQLRVTLLNITTDVAIPTVLALLESDEYPYATVGASCQTDPVGACCKALDEAVSVRFSLKQERWKQEVPDFESFGWVRRLEDHMILYGNWPHSSVLDFLSEAPVKTLSDFVSGSWLTQPSSLEDLTAFADRLLRDHELTVLVTELKCGDTAEYGYVERVVVPEMIPLSQDHNARWLASPRLLSRLDSATGPINEYPHPFA